MNAPDWLKDAISSEKKHHITPLIYMNAPDWLKDAISSEKNTILHH